jgi:hypothetical protein
MVSANLREVRVFEPQRELHEEVGDLCGRLVGEIGRQTRERLGVGVGDGR